MISELIGCRWAVSCTYLLGSVLMSKNVMSASIVAGLLFLWLGSGLWVERPSGSAPVTVVESGPVQQPAIATLSKVRVQLTKAEPRNQSVVLRGRTEAKRIVDATAEISGQVVRRSVERGEQVSRGQLLCEIAIDDRAMAVEEAQAALNKAEIEHEGSLRLAAQGLLSEVAIAASAARQEAAEAQLERQTLNLARTQITAPFDGVVEDFHLDEGDYVCRDTLCIPLAEPAGIWADDAHILVSDTNNHRVVAFRRGAREYETWAGGAAPGETGERE